MGPWRLLIVHSFTPRIALSFALRARGLRSASSGEGRRAFFVSRRTSGLLRIRTQRVRGDSGTTGPTPERLLYDPVFQ